MFDGPAYKMGANFGGTVTLATITDGTSNTVIFSESVRGQDNANVDGLYQIYKDTTGPDRDGRPARSSS